MKPTWTVIAAALLASCIPCGDQPPDDSAVSDGSTDSGTDAASDAGCDLYECALGTVCCPEGQRPCEDNGECIVFFPGACIPAEICPPAYGPYADSGLPNTGCGDTWTCDDGSSVCCQPDTWACLDGTCAGPCGEPLGSGPNCCVLAGTTWCSLTPPAWLR